MHPIMISIRVLSHVKKYSASRWDLYGTLQKYR